MSRPASKPARVDGRKALEDAAKREAQAFRPNSRPMFIAFGVNGLLAALLLVVPYFRGQYVAKGSLRAFATFASCAIGGEPEHRLGLSLPPAERSHFADKVLHADAGWPKRCIAALHKVAPEQAIFLWPAVKRAGADVSAAAALVEQELSAMAVARAQGVTRVPERPLLAITKLRAALTLLARGADVSDSVDEPALHFDDKKNLSAIEPTRLPIMAGDAAALDMWLRNGGIEMLALDARGLSWLALDDGQIDRTRVKRSQLLRGTVRVHDTDAPASYGVLAMPAERCEKDEHHCLRRATGVASIARDALFSADQENPLTPQWLGAHPIGRFDRSVRIDTLSIDVLAISDGNGATALRRFTRSEAAQVAPAEPGAAPKPASATEEWPLGVDAATVSATFFPERSALDVAVAEANGSGVEALLVDPRTGAELALGAVAGTAPFITACRDAHAGSALERSFIAYGSATELSLVRVLDVEVGSATEPTVTALAHATLSIEAPMHRDDPARDRVQVRCDGASSAALALTSTAELVAVQCEDTRCEQRTIGSDVAGFSAVLARDGNGAQLVLALSGKRDPSIALVTWRLGAAPSAPRVLAGCWDPAAGMCGLPALAADGAQVVLAARERADLRVIESLDAGVTWSARPDMVSATTNQLSAPLEQHRKRKGLDK